MIPLGVYDPELGKALPLNQTTVFRTLLAALMLQAISIGYYIYFIHFYGYLPSPFVSDKSDTFMDLYNTLWWGAHDGRYTEWRSIYPPLNFIIVGLMRGMIVPSGVGSDPVHLRSINMWPACIITALHLIAPLFIVAQSTWRGFSRVNRILIALVAILSPVFLFSIERGNLIILPIFLLPFIFTDREGWWKPLLLAVIINLKPYFALLVFAYAIVGNWRRFLQCLALAGAIFLLTGLVEDPNFLLFLKNIRGFADSAALQPLQLMALPASLSALSRSLLFFLNTTTSTSSYIAFLPALPPLIEAIKTGAIVLALYGLFSSRQTARQSEAFMVFLLVAITMGIWAGGYSQIFYLAAIPVFLTMRFRVPYLLLILAIFLPWDMVTLYSDPPAYGQSFITQSTVLTGWQLGLGSILRPFFITLLTIILGLELLGRKNKHVDKRPVATIDRALFPDWRVVLPFGFAGLIVGAAIDNFVITSQTAVAIIQRGADAEQADTAGFLTLLLERQSVPQRISERLQTFEITRKIAERMGDPYLVRELASQQYGGNGRLTVRMTSDGNFLEIKAELPDKDKSLRAAAIGADIAMQLNDTLSAAQNGQTGNDVAIRDRIIARTTSSVLSDEMPELSNAPYASFHPINKRGSRLVQAATLSKPMIDSWWLAALIGAIAGGSLGYAVSLSEKRGSYAAFS